MPGGLTPEQKARVEIDALLEAAGWQVQDYRGERIVSHGGGAPGYISNTTMIPGRNAGVSVFSNAEESLLVRTLQRGIVDLIMGPEKHGADFDWIADAVKLRDDGNARSIAAAAEISEATASTRRISGARSAKRPEMGAEISRTSEPTAITAPTCPALNPPSARIAGRKGIMAPKPAN